MPSSEKGRVAIYLAQELIERYRNCVVALSGPPERLTMSELAANAIEAEIGRLQAKYNNDQPFDQRDAAPRKGRPPE